MKKIIFLILFSVVYNTGFALQKSQSEQDDIFTYTILNQSQYLPGDTVFSNSFLLDESLHSVEGRHLTFMNLINHEGEVLQTSRFVISDGVGANQMILNSELPAGVYRIFAFTNVATYISDHPFQTKFAVIDEENPKADYSAGKEMSSALENSTPIKVSLEFKSQNFKPRARVELDLTLKNAQGNPIGGQFTVSVHRKDIFDSLKESNNREALFLSRLQAFKRRKSKEDYSEYIRTQNGRLKLIGKAYYGEDRKPIPAGSQVFFLMEKEKWTFQTVSYKDGEVWILLPEFYGQDRLFYMGQKSNGKLLDGLTIDWQNEKDIDYESVEPAETSANNSLFFTYVEKKDYIDASYNFYIEKDTILDVIRSSPSEAYEDMIGGTDITINVQDYYIFSSMVDLVKEVVPSVFYRKRKKGDIVKVSLPEPMEPARETPVFIIDGVITRDVDYFLNLNPKDLDEVKVVRDPRKLIPLGIMGKYGIIIVNTLKGDAGAPLAGELKVVNGLSENLEFPNIHKQELENTQKPIFQTTIHWNPAFKVGDSGNADYTFNLSDDLGEMNVVIEGFTNDGNYVYQQETLNVILAE